MSELVQIHEAVRRRAEEIVARFTEWPCRKGCDECCRRLAEAPRVTRAEWGRIAEAVERLEAPTADLVRQRMRETAGAERPVMCPLLERESGLCLVYEARPVACRAYGFYAERGSVLGCGRIVEMGAKFPEMVWGNHKALEREIAGLGEAVGLSEWVAGTEA